MSELVEQNRNVLQNYLDTGNYTAGYELMKAISAVATDANPNSTEFFNKAIGINGNDPTNFYNGLVRTIVEFASVNRGLTSDPNFDFESTFQANSDDLARTLIEQALGPEGFPTFETILTTDRQKMLEHFPGLEEEDYPGHTLAVQKLSPNSEFFNVIREEMETRGASNLPESLRKYEALASYLLNGAVGLYENVGNLDYETLKELVGVYFEIVGDPNREISDAFFKVNADFLLAETPPRIRLDPLTLDLDGDGLEVSDLNSSTVNFDLDNNGFAERTAWVGADDGLLALDRDANGTIDNGSELFGDATSINGGTGTAADGFAALSDLDSNADGVIDANDALFSDLKIWQDLNQNGVSDAGARYAGGRLSRLSPFSNLPYTTQNFNDSGKSSMQRAA
ncbi:MAG: hypothetical protein G3M78_04085 [Candidatus Nitrohelix vancouverensis]|uniref:Calcium-binding protein n=1 Tax=Candidatus Nitrohelix vancouverensis TaxID=2705534 RepID=A0A7T0C1E5_9BACT|nr:MAG: hypothetical protein G3M78_04085 [Candidatus Nitrohelix vancouverensis]